MMGGLSILIGLMQTFLLKNIIKYYTLISYEINYKFKYKFQYLLEIFSILKLFLIF